MWARTFDRVPLRLRAFTDDGQRRGLARPGHAIQSHHLFAGKKHLVNGLALRGIQLLVAVFRRNPNLRRNQHRVTHPALIAFLHPCDNLAFHAKHGSGGVLLPCACMIDRSEFAARGPLRELLPDVGIRCFTHAAIERRFQKVAPVQHCGTLEEMIAGIGHSLLRDSVRFVNVALAMLPSFGHNPVGLVSILCGQLAVPR